MFRDITTLIKDPWVQAGHRQSYQRYIKGEVSFDLIVGIEARGFIIGGALSYTLGKGFVPIRKVGKLPLMWNAMNMNLSTARIQLRFTKMLYKRYEVLVVDDLLATGGTALAAAALIEKLGGRSLRWPLSSISRMSAGEEVEDRGYNVYCLTEFEGD